MLHLANSLLISVTWMGVFMSKPAPFAHHLHIAPLIQTDVSGGKPMLIAVHLINFISYFISLINIVLGNRSDSNGPKVWRMI